MITEEKWNEIKEDLPNVFSKYEMQEMAYMDCKDIEAFKQEVAKLYFERKAKALDKIFERGESDVE